ncbi:MAG: long-chain fatty acid--CoA ligase [Bacteroidales bacterium]|nr:long-chain fatty acid--CoA ligase [Bacteroidales bacterium]MBN2819440.1 long-chain fatty acid--CoA ligase [Bacteroidales bacterium]
MEATRIFDILDRISNQYTEKDDVLAVKENGNWIKYSAKEYREKADTLSYGLLAMGLVPGDKIATVSNNRPEWNFLDMAMNQAGIIHVPVYPTISDSDFKYLLNHAEPKLLVVSDKSLFSKLEPIAGQVGALHEIITFNEIEGAKNWKEIYELGRSKESEYKDKLIEIRNSIKPADLTTIIYTSGTTGNPKGVMLSHHNIMSNLAGILETFNFGPEDKTLSFLPLSHIFERTIDYYFQYAGVSIYYAESLGTIGPNLLEIKPDVFIAVPRVIESVYDKIIGKGKDLKGIKKQIFFWAVNLGLRFDYNKKQGLFYSIQLKLASKLVFAKWRDAVGGNVRMIVTGGAAIQPRLSRVFGAAGIPLIEGYGMTETSPVIAANNFDKGEVMAGTVGPVFPGVNVKLSDDGEILVNGPTVMMGYYKDPENTKETIDEDGWLHTGDIGVFVENKYLKITDRKKEIFKLSSGKYIAPQAIENKIKESFFIEQAFVFGENQKFASAIIVPNLTFLHNWCSLHNVKYRDNDELIHMAEVVKRYQKEMNEINKQLGQTEQIKRFKLVEDNWSAQTGELSPTLKLRRRFLFEKYKKIIEEIFAVDSSGK